MVSMSSYILKCCFIIIAMSFVDPDEISECYLMNDENYCFYTNGWAMSWNDAREFCAARNSMLPIITDKNIDNVFQQFIVNDSYNVIEHRSVWLDAYARHVNNSVRWHWINGQPSALSSSDFVSYRDNRYSWCAAVARRTYVSLDHVQPVLIEHDWTIKRHYVCQYDNTSCDDAFQLGSSCYKVHRETVNWFTAVNRCLSNNATLAVFDDDVRNYFPSSELTPQSIFQAWIGLLKSWWTWPALMTTTVITTTTPATTSEVTTSDLFSTTSSETEPESSTVSTYVYVIIVAAVIIAVLVVVILLLLKKRQIGSDGCNFMTRERHLQDAGNEDRQESNRTHDSPYFNSVEKSAPAQESSVDDYSAPIEYEDVGQLGSNTGVYHELDPMTIEVPHQYSSLNTRPNNNVSSADVYQEIH